MNYIVTTTISEPTEATVKFSEKKDWTLIVVGDTKTPHQLYEEINCIYLSPEDQDKLYPELSSKLGWRTIQRRNIGFIYAYNNGAEVVATVDDDNIPYDDWGTDLHIGKTIDVDLWESANGFFDPLSVTNRNDLWHRGYPLSLVPTKNDVTYLGKHKRRVLIQADLWDGDPDIDAACRITKAPTVKYDIKSPFGSNQVSPFNSQNTFLDRRILPYYMVLPFVGRMDDIWGGYEVLRFFKENLIYNRASVYQDRNEQDLVTNLENEVIGYRNTLRLLKDEILLSGISPKSHEAYRLYQSYFNIK
jgi:hypothetical protein